MSAFGVVGNLGQRLLALAERRLPALTRLRAVEALPIRLHRRRIYVLPSLFGIGFAALLLIMQLGALNYANNPALLLTCLLGAAAWMSLYAGFRCISGLELSAIQATESHAGSSVSIRCRFASSTRSRPNLRIRWAGIDHAFAIAAGPPTETTLELPAQRRGWMHPGRLKLWTDQPLGLFVIWSWLNPEFSVLIYPALEASPPPFPFDGKRSGIRMARNEGDEYSGLRDYRSGDPQRQIAWKASARHDSLLVRESERLIQDDLHFDYAAIRGLDHEARIRRLTAWVVAADNAELGFTLELPDQCIGPGHGALHRHACLRALALLPDAH
ncbi:MAG TPA: DUF58 domain-containing protein [Dokdonella sp.]|uniref:DUF58 domain-containing protein n=1 Tax=Dokdonella sp. TaxID=2291710 RepID=UPI002D7EEE5F|nr:DUF58 domain-containing protein [Dokdonella sp.]HET9031298.1 DUF58 domain-containing protein [Dokdonella sp.]